MFRSLDDSFMKKILSIVLMAEITAVVMAVPARRGVTKTLRLADGTTVSAQLCGDEYCHYWQGSDGQAYRSTHDNVYTPIDLADVYNQKQQLMDAANKNRANCLPRYSQQRAAYTGTKRGLVILVNFSDLAFQPNNDLPMLQRIVNEPNFAERKYKGSVHDYFFDQSDGQFDLTFDVVGPYTLSQPYAYYGHNNEAGHDSHPGEMVIEAVKMADEHVNYTDYDWDGDGAVDQVFILYAGYGESEGTNKDTVWPHENKLSVQKMAYDGNGPQALDGVTIDTYACGHELDYRSELVGIGIFCHEFSHCLGFPDFYDTQGEGKGMGDYDVLATGCYNGDGYCPCGYTGYERWMAGWRTPVEIYGTQHIDAMKSLEGGGESYIVYNESNRNEYYMLDNRQRVKWDERIPSVGMVIVHVDYDKEAWKDNRVNVDPNHQRMSCSLPLGRASFLACSLQNIRQSNNADRTLSFDFINIPAPVISGVTPFDGQVTVTITQTAGDNASVYYTLDGSKPSQQSTLYTEPFILTKTTTVKAITMVDGRSSTVSEKFFKANPNFTAIWNGQGTADDPFLISSADNLNQIADIVNNNETDLEGKYFLLTTDISYDDVNPNNYTPIGYYYWDENYSSTSKNFNGHFDGGGHTISGINAISEAINITSYGQALFCAIGPKGSVRNLTVDNAIISGASSCSGIVGSNYGLVENCHVTSSVTINVLHNFTSMRGGVVGYNQEGGIVRGCSSAVTIKAGGRIYAEANGGVVGGNYGIVTDCLYLGNTVEGDGSRGAIVGYNNEAGTLHNNLYTTTVLKGVDGEDMAFGNGAVRATVTKEKPATIGNVTTEYGAAGIPGITAYDNGLYYQGAYYLAIVDPTGIAPAATAHDSAPVYHTLDGRTLNTVPTQKGIYIAPDGKKFIRH